MNPARFLLPARGAGVLTRELDARNLSRGDRVKSPDCLSRELRPAFGSGGFSGRIRAMVRASVARADHGWPSVKAERLACGPYAGEGISEGFTCAAAGGGLSPVPGNAILAFDHDGRIGTAEAGRNQPLATGGFRGGNTAPHAPGALTECATFQNAAGGNQ